MGNDTTDGPGAGLFAFRYSPLAVLAIITGVVGCLANGLVLLILIVDKTLRKNSSTFLIKYQLVVDFVSCISLIVSYSLKLLLGSNGETMKRWGVGVCMFFIGDCLAFIAAYTATTNLGVIAFERYVKIVHAVKHRMYFRK